MHCFSAALLTDAFEQRKVVIANIPGAFLSANWPIDAPECHIWFEGTMVDMLCQLKPEYKKIIQYTNIKGGGMNKVLVGKVTKVIYGTLLEAVLFYNKLKGVLTNLGFKMNDYNEFTFNKMIDGKQCTIQFHADDLKLSHLEQDELDKIIDHLNGIFDSDKELIAT